MDLGSVFAVTISFNERESETVHIISQHGTHPTEAEIEALVAPYVRRVYHESGRFEIEDVVSVKESIENLLSYSR